MKYVILTECSDQDYVKFCEDTGADRDQEFFAQLGGRSIMYTDKTAEEIL